MSLTFGYAAALEQFHPTEILEISALAEQHGFSGVMAADHFQPWTPSQGQSAFVWNVLSALGERTVGDIGPGVTAPTFRWHPAMVAQASATLAEMFPGRFWLALGTGQNMNEHITGDKWPDKAQRQARLEESVELIRRLHTGAEVTYRGQYVTAERARIYSLPAQPPALIGPALSPPTAARAAAWADGLITINSEPAEMREIVAAYRDNGGTGPLALQVHVSIAPTLAEARDIARDQWRNHPFAEPIPHDTATPEDFDAMGQFMPDEEIAGAVVITDSVTGLVDQLREYEQLGFEEIYLHHVAQDQSYFLELARHELLPRLREG